MSENNNLLIQAWVEDIGNQLLSRCDTVTIDNKTLKVEEASHSSTYKTYSVVHNGYKISADPFTKEVRVIGKSSRELIVEYVQEGKKQKILLTARGIQ